MVHTCSVLYRCLLLASVSLLTLGCRKKNAYSPPCNLTYAKQAVQEYYEDGHYREDLVSVVSQSINYFQRCHQFQDNDVAIFDVDETLLLSYPDSKNIQFGYIPKLYHDWVIKAQTPAVPEVKRLYDFFVYNGCKIILLTNRRDDAASATLRNLSRLGFHPPFQAIFRTDHENKDSAATYKARHRALIAARGYRIVACVGDQESDMSGGNTGYQVKIPNYIYIID
jgi:predicted secreted acid phosphatase